MDIRNNNTDSDADSNISQILLSDDDRKPSAQQDPPPRDTSAKKKTPNLGIALFSHQKKNTHFSFSSSNDNNGIENPPNDKAPPNYKAAWNPSQSGAQKAPTKNWNTDFMVPILVSIHFWWYKAYKKELLQEQPFFYFYFYFYLPDSDHQVLVEPNRVEFDGVRAQHTEQVEAAAAKASSVKQKKAKSVSNSKGDISQDYIEYDITKGVTFPCPKYDHMMVMPLDTTESIAAYNQKVDEDHEGKMDQYNCLAHCMMADKGGNCKRCWSKYSLGVEFLNPHGEDCSCQICNCQCNVFTESTRPATACAADPMELEEDTALKTMPGLVSMIYDLIAEATHSTYPGEYNSNNPHLGSAKFQKRIKEAMEPIKNTSSGKSIYQLQTKHKGKAAAPFNDTRFHSNRLD
eukprot:jgi/Psemu1/9138/gm1.9138_g